MIEEAAKAMGVGIGNLNTLSRVEFPKAGAIFPHGTTLSGNVADELDNQVDSLLDYQDN